MRKIVAYAVWLQQKYYQLLERYVPDVIQMGGHKDLTNYAQNPAVEDLDLGLFALLTKNLSLYEGTSNNWYLRNRAKTTWQNLSMGGLAVSSLNAVGTTLYINAPLGNNQISYWRAGLNGVATTCAKLNSHITAPNFEINRAGDITLLSGKSLNCLNGILRLPDSQPAGPSAGDCRYDAATDTFEIYDGAAWNAH